MKTKISLSGFKYLVPVLAALCTLTILVQNAYSCDVPVFRYALERWKPDAYKGIYIHRGEISKEDKLLLKQLKDASAYGKAPLNLIIREVNADSFDNKKLTELLQGPVPDNLPILVIWYPEQMGKKPPLWKEKLTPSFIKALMQSPKRQQMAEDLITGDSVIWVFIPSGNEEKDRNAKNVITQELEKAVATFSKMPYTILEGSKQKKLTYVFPVLTVTRDDPAERVFIDALMRSESDLYEYTDEPMVFPVFGRGRVLGCLFGKYITAEKIRDAANFLSGACSCEVKNLNPGVDLLVAAPWDYVVMTSFVDAEPMPELTGVMPDFDNVKVPVASFEKDPVSEKTEIPENNTNLLMLYGITLSGIILLVIIISIIIKQRRKE